MFQIIFSQTVRLKCQSVAATKGITQLGCWAHARRKFIDVQKATESKAQKTNKISKADMAVSLIAKLYAIEKGVKDADSDTRYQIRE